MPASRLAPLALVVSLTAPLPPLLLLLAACTTEEESTTTLDASPDALRAFAADLAAALCEVNARCDLGLYPAETARCLETQAALGFAPVPEHLVDDGTLRLDTAQAQRCLDAIDTLVCAEADRLFYDDLGIMQRTCPAAIVGTVAEGESCYEALECAPGLFCERDGGDPFGGGSCPGTCRPLHGLPCPGDADAGQPEPTVFCDPRTERCDPADDTCKPLSGVGGVCPFGGHECREGLVCEDGTCRPAPEAGESCAEGPCAQHLHCIDAVCQYAVWGLGEGEPCGGLRHCGNGLDCADPEGGEGDGVCQPLAQLGEPCGEGAARCERDLYCASGSCATPLAVGAACSGVAAGECGGGWCEGGVCVTDASCARP